MSTITERFSRLTHGEHGRIQGYDIVLRLTRLGPQVMRKGLPCSQHMGPMVL